MSDGDDSDLPPSSAPAEAPPPAPRPPRPPRTGGDGRPANTLRDPPNNLDLERAILAVLLDGRHPTAIHTLRAAQIDHPLYFWQRDHRLVYLACLELGDQDTRIDAQAVAELLSRYRFGAALDKLRQQQVLLEADQLDGLGRARARELWKRKPEDEAAAYEDSALAARGGVTAALDLQQAYGALAGLERNVALLKDYFLKRRLIVRLQLICDRAYRTPDEFPAIVDDAARVVMDLGRFNQAAQIHSVNETVDRTMERIQHSIDNPDEGIKTGIDDLDARLMALRPGGLYVLAARPGVGKTSFALKIASNVCNHPERRNRTLFISLEVDRVDLLKKLFSAEAGIEFEKLERGTLLQPHELETLAETSKRLGEWPLDLMDVSDLTVHALRSAVKRRKLDADAGCDLLMIDYLQLLKETRSDMHEYEKVSEITRVLKVMARELKIPVVALSQMSRDSEKGASDKPRAPKLSDLRGSGTIEQDADAVIFLHRVDSGDGGKDEGVDACRRIEVVVAKNRFGPQGKAAMNFFPAKMRFTPAAAEDRLTEPEDAVAPGQPTRRERLQAAPGKDEDLF
jgi:replicative DNA helicase